MFNVGGPELIVIAMVALIVLGPDKLPGALRQAGRFMGELRKISSGFQTDLRTAIADAEREAEEESTNGRPPTGSGVESGQLAAQAELDALGVDATPANPALERETDAASSDGDDSATD